MCCVDLEFVTMPLDPNSKRYKHFEKALDISDPWHIVQLSHAFDDEAGSEDRHLHLELDRHEDGRAQAASISARLDLASTDARAFERFLRRVVRGVYAAA